MKEIRGVLVLLLVLSLSFASAEMTISQPQDTYNLGDKLYISTSGLLGSDAGNLNIDLVCGNHTTNLVKISARVFSLTEEQSYSVPYKTLDKSDLEINNLYEILGECQIVASMGNRIATTKKFTITNRISLAASLDQSTYDPGEQIKLRIDAVKLNGNPVNGFLEVSNATSFQKTIEEGSATEVFSMPATTEAGTYTLDLFAYDKDSSGVLNGGDATATFTINQIASSIIMSMSEESIKPGGNFTIKTELYDQSGKQMEGALPTTIVSPEGDETEIVLYSGELKSLDFPSNATAGTYTITSTYNNRLMQQRQLELEELQKASFIMDGSTLTIKNIGNTIYNKTIDLQIGDKTENLQLNIGIGESRKFNLAAPNGEYDVSVDDGETSISGRALLTGNAISVDSLRTGFIKNYAILWIFLTIMIGTVAFVFFRKTSKTKKIKEFKSEKKKMENPLSKVKNLFKSNVEKKIPKNLKSHASDSIHFTNKSPSVQGLDDENYNHEDKTMLDLTRGRGPKEAESSVIAKGTKHTSCIVSVSIKNLQELNDTSKQEIRKIVSNSQGKGLADWRENYVFLVFSPMVTRTYHNEIRAVKVAQKIQEEFKSYNKKFKDKIQFNIGVNSGEMVASQKEGKFKYTSIGNTISFSKRIADADSDKVMVSESIRKKLLRDLRVENIKEISGNKVYEVLGIKDRSKDAQKLQELMKRMDK